MSGSPNDHRNIQIMCKALGTWARCGTFCRKEQTRCSGEKLPTGVVMEAFGPRCLLHGLCGEGGSFTWLLDRHCGWGPLWNQRQWAWG